MKYRSTHLIPAAREHWADTLHGLDILPPDRPIQQSLVQPTMTLRPADETLESLRVTLHKLEHTADPDQNADSMAAFKSVLLNRMADLELAATLAPADAEISRPPAPDDLVMPTSMAESDPRKEVIDTTQLEKLD